MEQRVYPFQKMPLPYPFNALEPHIDTRTMIIHHDRHYGKYVDELNSYLEIKLALQNLTLTELITAHSDNVIIRRNAGGVFNHEFFFAGMRPAMGQIVVGLGGRLLQNITRDFGSFENMKEHFLTVAAEVFGSGYVWLCVDCKGRLVIVSTANQDTPLTMKLRPLLTLDVWEHAYYLKHQNQREDYIKAFWAVIDWVKVGERLSLN
jgi:Fe-Mn family superoxide dismutase